MGLVSTIGILWDKEDDPELAMAYARAYNNWQWDFARPTLDRICTSCAYPLYDVDLAYAELKRCLDLGFKGMFMAQNPSAEAPVTPDFDPIWQLLTDADLPICVHLIVRFNRVVNLSNTRWWDINTERPDTVFSLVLAERCN